MLATTSSNLVSVHPLDLVLRGRVGGPVATQFPFRLSILCVDSHRHRLIRRFHHLCSASHLPTLYRRWAPTVHAREAHSNSVLYRTVRSDFHVQLGEEAYANDVDLYTLGWRQWIVICTAVGQSHEGKGEQRNRLASMSLCLPGRMCMSKQRYGSHPFQQASGIQHSAMSRPVPPASVFRLRLPSSH